MKQFKIFFERDFDGAIYTITLVDRTEDSAILRAVNMATCNLKYLYTKSI